MKNLKKLVSLLMVTGVLTYSIIANNSYILVRNNYQANAYADSIEKYAPYFEEASVEFGVPASILMALAIHETGMGSKGVGSSKNNLFGVSKSSKYSGSGTCTGSFECYDSVKDSIRDAARILGDPTSYYKLTNIIITDGSLDTAYEDITKSITAHWCVGDCSYDFQSLLDTAEAYGLYKYDNKLKQLSSDELKAILEKYYGENAIEIPGYDGVDNSWDGNITVPEISDYDYSSLYFSTSYGGDITKGYIYLKYKPVVNNGLDTMWNNLSDTEDEGKVTHIIKNIFFQGEKLYGDKKLHFDGFIADGSSITAPISFEGSYTDGIPLSCYTKVTSSFNDQESFRTAKHKGMDLAAPMGTSIHSVTDGIVVSSSGGCPATGYYGNKCGGGYGNYVKIRANDGTIFIYAHMFSTPSVASGQIVTKGQQIGAVGSSGSSTGPHLHFEVRDKNNTKINPTPYSNYQSIPHC